ncbi:MAG: hypothetical protein IBX55_00545 [Methyloprofundus sp.]|nr:hypothetical protein [Methyloprofundus sp.]
MIVLDPEDNTSLNVKIGVKQGACNWDSMSPSLRDRMSDSDILISFKIELLSDRLERMKRSLKLSSEKSMSLDVVDVFGSLNISKNGEIFDFSNIGIFESTMYLSDLHSSLVIINLKSKEDTESVFWQYEIDASAALVLRGLMRQDASIKEISDSIGYLDDTGFTIHGFDIFNEILKHPEGLDIALKYSERAFSFYRSNVLSHRAFSDDLFNKIENSNSKSALLALSSNPNYIKYQEKLKHNDYLNEVKQDLFKSNSDLVDSDGYQSQHKGL